MIKITQDKNEMISLYGKNTLIHSPNRHRGKQARNVKDGRK
jgi:hypothetical protein